MYHNPLPVCVAENISHSVFEITMEGNYLSILVTLIIKFIIFLILNLILRLQSYLSVSIVSVLDPSM